MMTARRRRYQHRRDASSRLQPAATAYDSFEDAVDIGWSHVILSGHARDAHIF